MYNLPESSTPNTDVDKSRFTGLCSSLSLQVHITAATRLGKKEPNKMRPLHVCLDNEMTKRKVLSRSSQLRSKPDWENVYVNPDMTLAERNATNRLLRQELKERRNRGEKNLIIRRNKIVSLSKPQSVSMEVSSPAKLSNNSSSSISVVNNTSSATPHANQSSSVIADVPPTTS